MNPSKPMRCAIYTRKSTERGLDMNVTSLEAQRDICQSYVKCQAHRKWIEIPNRYDDGGFSGGTLERPGLRRLLADVEAGYVDAIIIYKLDRLTRSLLDFVRLAEVLQRYNVSFVSVTQAFDTSDSMGRLILNILLTFAQFERELMSDRVRDKKAAMQKKGYFTGGLPPFGYLIDTGGRLCIDDERAPVVREVYRRYSTGTSVKALVDDFRKRRLVTRHFQSRSGHLRGGQPITTATLRHILENPVYTGHIVHRGDWIEAQIDPLVTRELWDLVQTERRLRAPKQDVERDFLIGLLRDEVGRPMRTLRSGPGRTNPFRYYRSEASAWSRGTVHKGVLVNADQIETLVRGFLIGFLRDRAELRHAIMSQRSYSAEIASLLKRGNEAARRLENIDAQGFRQALVALVPRVDVTRTQIVIHVSVPELSRFLAWDGSAVFSRSGLRTGTTETIFPIFCAACLVRGHPRHVLPVEPCPSSAVVREPRFAGLVDEAIEIRDALFSSRTRTVLELATEKGVSQTHFAKLVRINYLAPDILAALIDGTQPAGITRHRVLEASMLLDWDRQREMLGFRNPHAS